MSKTSSDNEKTRTVRTRVWVDIPGNWVVLEVWRINSRGKRVSVKYRVGSRGLKVRHGEKGDRCKVVVEFNIRQQPALNSNTIQAWPLAVTLPVIEQPVHKSAKANDDHKSKVRRKALDSTHAKIRSKSKARVSNPPI